MTLKLAEELGARRRHRVLDGKGAEHSVLCHVSLRQPPGLEADRVILEADPGDLGDVDPEAACRRGIEGALESTRRASGGDPPPLEARVTELETEPDLCTDEAIAYTAWTGTLAVLEAADWTWQGETVQGSALTIPQPPVVRAAIESGIVYQFPG